MFRLMLAMMGLLVSSALDAGAGGNGGEGGSGEGGGTGGGGQGGSGSGDTFTLSETELTQRTNAAAEAKQKEIAELLGIEPDKIADAKGLIEAGRKAAQAAAGDDEPAGDKSGDGEGEGKTIEERLAKILKPITDRLGNIEQTEQTRQQQQAEQTRSEKLSAALKEAGVRDERMEHVARYAGTFDVKVNDNGELEGSQAAIDAAKQAFPDAFRGEGDTGQAADATDRDGKPRPRTLTEALTAHYQKG